MYNYNDAEIGLLRRVSGFWQVESPKRTLGVSVKIDGSDLLGPNKRALESYKEYKESIAALWCQSIQKIINENPNNDGTPRFKADEFRLSEIIINDPKKSEADIVYCFDIDSAPNEYGVCIKNGKVDSYYSLYSINR